jgi:hypothetical protein
MHTVIILSDRTIKKWALQFCLQFFLGIHRNPKQKYEWGIFEIMSFIQFYPLLGQSLKYILDKVPEWHFLSTFNKGIWSKKTSNFKQGLKLANFQNGLRWLCPVSAALKNPSQESKNSFCFGCQLKVKTRKSPFF